MLRIALDLALTVGMAMAVLGILEWWQARRVKSHGTATKDQP